MLRVYSLTLAFCKGYVFCVARRRSAVPVVYWAFLARLGPFTDKTTPCELTDRCAFWVFRCLVGASRATNAADRLQKCPSSAVRPILLGPKGQSQGYSQLLKGKQKMKKLLTIILITFSVTASGQVNPTIWDSLKSVTTNNYELKTPSSWRQIPSDGQGPEQLFEASGKALPKMANGSPVIVTTFLVMQNSKNLDDCKDKCLNGYRTNPDREFPKKFKDGQEKLKLSSGQDAYLLNTRFFRKSKQLNQSRFDLIIYSDKAKTGYIYTISIQYNDNDYKFETENNLTDFAKKLYSYFALLN